MKSIAYRMDLAARLHESKGSLYLARYLREQKYVLDRITSGKPYISNTFYVPGEICRLFDVEVVYSERLAGFASASGMLTENRLEHAACEEIGCACSYQLAFDCLLRDKLIPLPDLFIAMSYVCDDTWKYYHRVSKKEGIPLLSINTGTDVQYLGKQLREAYEWLGERYKQVRPIEEVVGTSNRTMDMKRQIDGLRLKYPGILSSTDAFKLFTLYNDMGADYAYGILNRLKHEISGKARTYRLPNGPRILRLGLVPLYDIGLIERIEKKYKCKIVYEELFDFIDVQISIPDFFTDLANRIFSSVYYSASNRLRAILWYIDALKVDGIVHFAQRNCVFLPSMLPLMRNELAKIAIPFVEISGDVVNPGYFDENGFRDLLDTFFASINEKNKKKYS